ncbi:MAG: DNA repair protein RadC [Muribaculaceae bacterium]|nr:DNA repair protein RadC [Muribaculaceae bacterium]
MSGKKAFEGIPEYDIEGGMSLSQQPAPLPKVQEMSEDEQPREKARLKGIKALSTAELFAIVLRTGLPGYPVTTLCRDMMRMASDNLLLLQQKERAELTSIRGLGDTKALQVEAVMEIARRYSEADVPQRLKIMGPEDINTVMRTEIANLPHEEMWVILMNRQHQVIGKMRVSEGGYTATVFDCKKILRNAILARAEAVALAHNHPSGNLRPSPQDDSITRKFKEACATMEIHFVDHLIITSSGYYSYRNESAIL